LQDHAYAEKEVHKWFMIGDYFYTKIIGWKPPCPPMLPVALFISPLILMTLVMSFSGSLMKKLPNKRWRKSKS